MTRPYKSSLPRLMLLLASASISALGQQPGGVDPNYMNSLPGADNGVTCIAARSDGKVLIGGYFTNVNEVFRGGIARLNSDGTVDPTFQNRSLGVQGTVASITLQSDGKILIGGTFSAVNGVARRNLARLTADGSLDATFQAGLNWAWVSSTAIQSDGKILLGGVSSVVNGDTQAAVVRLNADGSLDPSFSCVVSFVNTLCSTIALQKDGKILIGGFFSAVNGEERNHLARLNSDGSTDPTFLNGMSGIFGPNGVKAVALQSDGKVLIGGWFWTVNGSPRGCVARLNTDGSLDTTFMNGLAGTDGRVDSLALQSDGRVLIAGLFQTVNGVGSTNVARLNPNGSLDRSFSNALSALSWSANAIALQNNGKVLVGGFFRTRDILPKQNIARLNSDGALDQTFLNGLSGAVGGQIDSLALQSDGRLIIGGRFTTVNGVTRNHVARLNTDGSLDRAFLEGLPGVTGGKVCTVFSLAVQSDGKVLIGGLFTNVNGLDMNSAARLNRDGSLDTTFVSGLSANNGAVYSIAVQESGDLLLGGFFPSGPGHLARLDSNGSWDPTFLNGLSGPNFTVRSIAVQKDGKVLIGGAFSIVNDEARRYLARLNSDGSLDPTFLNGLSGPNAALSSMALQDDGKLLVGGSFTTVNDTPKSYFARLNSDGSLDPSFLNGLSGADGAVYSIVRQGDGRVIIAGDFRTVNGVSRGGVARLNSNGSLDTAFLNNLSGADTTVQAAAVQNDGTVLVGGNFSSVSGTSRGRIARLYGGDVARIQSTVLNVGLLQLTFTNVPGNTGQWWTSTNLMNWTLHSEVSIVGGKSFTNFPITGEQGRFFRALIWP